MATDLITAADVTDPRLLRRADLASLISAASLMALHRTNRNGFLSETTTELYDGNNAPRVWLRRTPVTAVTAVTVNGFAVDNTYGDGWTFRPDTGELRRGTGQVDQRFAWWFPKGLQNVEVTYTAGYSSVPADVVRAVLILVKHLADSSKVTGLFQSEKLGDYSYTLADLASVEFPPLADKILQNYEL
jgi:hypothetical protein